MKTSRAKREAKRAEVAGIIILSILIASVTDHALASRLGFSMNNSGNEIGTYRRIGPETGPQVFCAGSSLLQFGLSWSEISASIGQGIENWGVGGSSPEIWEVSQRRATNSNLMIIGVSVYDLNEYRLSDSRAAIVPLPQTIRDLRDSGADWQFSLRLLDQYPLTYLRLLFPTAAYSDKVLVGLRSMVREELGLAAAAEDKENALFLPSKPILEFGESKATVSEWSSARLRRRLALVRAENQGAHSFNGPKRLAFHRMLLRARQQGRIVVVILPVTKAYADEFLTPDVINRFERSMDEALRLVPGATVIRLDKVTGLMSHDSFTDLVRLNSAGRQVATEAFLSQLQESRNDGNPDVTSMFRSLRVKNER